MSSGANGETTSFLPVSHIKTQRERKIVWECVWWRGGKLSGMHACVVRARTKKNELYGGSLCGGYVLQKGRREREVGRVKDRKRYFAENQGEGKVNNTRVEVEGEGIRVTFTTRTNTAEEEDQTPLYAASVTGDNHHKGKGGKYFSYTMKIDVRTHPPKFSGFFGG